MSKFTVKSEDLNFSDGLKVISSAQKFVIPVPAFPNGGEPLVYPATVKDVAGNSIADWQGKPIGKMGIVFFNGKDGAWQAAEGDGSAVIIVNRITEEQASKIDAYIRTENYRTNFDFTVDELKQILKYINTDLGIDDMYNSNQKFIAEKMTRIGSDTGIIGYGFYKRDDRDICEAVYINGAGEFQGPAATPQQFERGAVIVRQGESVRLIQPEIFVETYRHANGSILELSEVPIAMI